MKNTKFTEKQYKEFMLKEQPFMLRILHRIKVLKFEVIDKKAWNNNNDYNYNVKLVKFNPFSYFVLLFFIPLAFFIGGFNKNTYRDIKKELKRMW